MSRSHQRVKIFGIFDDDAHGTTVKPQRTLDTSRKPIALDGDLIALCDYYSETLVLNWKTDEQALLKSPDRLNVGSGINIASSAQSCPGPTAGRRFYQWEHPLGRVSFRLHF